jgi:exodeoxyribonuclease V alpha subunit
MTIHKSKGSEFDQVALILPNEVVPLLTRQLIYTGITRAKQNVDIVASEAVLVSGVKAEVVQATRIASLVSLGDKEVVEQFP